MTRDETVVAQIEALVAEEQKLRRSQPVDAAEPAALEADRRRVREIEVDLDRCWDLLRQRRAREEFGQDPDAAIVRDEETVEHYLQ